MSGSIEERFARFSVRPDVADVTSRYGDWANSSDGIMLNLQLSGLAMMRVAGRLSRNDYKRSIRNLASTSGICLGDFLIMAEYGLELARSDLAGSGQIPFTPERWDAEEGEA